MGSSHQEEQRSETPDLNGRSAEQKVCSAEQKVCSAEQKVCSAEQKVSSAEQKVCSAEQRVCSAEQRVSSVEQKACSRPEVTGLQLRSTGDRQCPDRPGLDSQAGQDTSHQGEWQPTNARRRRSRLELVAPGFSRGKTASPGWQPALSGRQMSGRRQLCRPLKRAWNKLMARVSPD